MDEEYEYQEEEPQSSGCGCSSWFLGLGCIGYALVWLFIIGGIIGLALIGWDKLMGSR
jgi:hypothetical protein